MKSDSDTGRRGDGASALMQKGKGRKFGVILESGLFGKFEEFGYIYCIWI